LSDVRTELINSQRRPARYLRAAAPIIFMTPRVIYDTNQIVDASEEIRSRLKQLRREVRE
jgi:hypothetical protein